MVKARGTRYPQPIMTPTKFSVGPPRLVVDTPRYLPFSNRGSFLQVSSKEFQLIVDALVIAANSNSELRMPIQSFLECLYRFCDKGLIDVEQFNAITSARHLKLYIDTS